MDKHPCVDILASRRHGTLYTGVTSNLVARLHQHRTGTIEGFTKRYAVHHLVWYELHEDMDTQSPARRRSRNGTATGKRV